MEDFSSKRAKHVIVISYDAFSEDNWDFASSLPNLSQLISKGVYSNDLGTGIKYKICLIHTSRKKYAKIYILFILFFVFFLKWAT